MKYDSTSIDSERIFVVLNYGSDRHLAFHEKEKANKASEGIINSDVIPFRPEDDKE